MVLERSEGVAKLMMASSAVIRVTMAGMRQLPAMRAEDAAAVPGTQTVYLPGEGANASLLDERGLYRRREDDPLRAALDAYRAESAAIKAGKYES
jgi:hypothetical protein